MKASLLIPIAIAVFVITMAVESGRRQRKLNEQPLTGPEFLQGGESTPGPRQPKLAASGKLLIGFIATLVTLAVILGSTYYQMIQLDRRYDLDGGLTTAAVTRMNGPTLGRNSHYDVDYKFEVGGISYSGLGELARSQSIEAANRTGKVWVRYLRSQPEVNQPADEPRTSLVMVIVIFTMFSFLPILVLYQIITDYRFVARGQKVEALVISKTKLPKGKCQVFYDFADRTGQVSRGSVAMGRVRAPEVGSRLEVYYLPENPAKSRAAREMTWKG
jgi:hypothetical protein